jgi:hypothetical protein
MSAPYRRWIATAFGLAMTGKVLRWCGAGVDICGDEMIVMLRANEVFDSAQPDTFACALWLMRVLVF